MSLKSVLVADDEESMCDFLRRECERRDNGPLNVSKGAMRLLVEYDWPGNVRELENVIERALLLCENGTIKSEHLPETILHPKKTIIRSFQESIIPTMESVQKAYIYWILESQNWHKEKSANLLSVDPSTLYTKIKQYELSKSQGETVMHTTHREGGSHGKNTRC